MSREETWSDKFEVLSVEFLFLELRGVLEELRVESFCKR